MVTVSDRFVLRHLLMQGTIQHSETAMPRNSANRIEVENVNHPKTVRSVDAEMYNAMRKAYLRVVPEVRPGLTLEEIRERLVTHLPDALFPDGAKVGWWAKTVQLDLEAKGIIARSNTRPIRIHRVTQA